MSAQPIEILMVEDNEGDVLLTTTALQRAKVHNRLNVVEDGVEALAYLRRQGQYADARRPDLILQDLNLPRVDGRQVLAEIKRDEDLKAIPVVVLTSSQAEQDVLMAYNHGANCYVVKPVDFSRLLEIVKTIEEFWLTVVKLPPKPA